MSIILVGNGPSLLDKPRGALIDAFDTVVRFNQYVLRDDLKSFTGTKTDVWAVNEGLVDGQQKPPLERPIKTLLCVPFWKPTEGCIWTRLRDWPGLWLDGVELIDEKAARLMTFTWPGQWVSTGLLAIFHCVLEYGRVSIIGFDNFDPSKKHHYGDDDIPFCGHHAPFEEQTTIRSMEVRGLLTKL